MTSAPPEPSPLPAPRAVAADRAFAWFATAMALFKRSPARWCTLAVLTLGAEFVLQFIPGVGVALTKVLLPVVACGFLLGAAAVERGEPLRMRVAFAAFTIAAGPLAAIIVAELLVFAVEWLVAYGAAGIDLLASGGDGTAVPTYVLVEMLAAGMLVSLPLLFVPLAALFEGATFAESFGYSWHGFALNQVPLLIYGFVSLILVGFGLATLGLGLIIAIPLISVASYAAWKDIFHAVEGEDPA